MNKTNSVFESLLIAGEIDKVVHEPARLLLLSILYVIEHVDFVFLYNLTGLTRGNFSTHISKLDEEGYIEVKKEFVERKPTTIYSISAKGRIALETYRDQMKKILSELE